MAIVFLAKTEVELVWHTIGGAIVSALRPSLDHTRKARRHDRCAEEFGLLPKARTLVLLLL